MLLRPIPTIKPSSRLADEFVDDARPVELGGVDVVDAQLDGAAQQCHGGVEVAVQALELHGAEADTGDGAARERAGTSGAGSAVGRELGGSGGGRHGCPVFVRRWVKRRDSVTGTVALNGGPPL